MVKINDLAGYINPNTILYERMKYYIGNTKSKHKVFRGKKWGCRGRQGVSGGRQEAYGEARGSIGKTRGSIGKPRGS